MLDYRKHAQPHLDKFKNIRLLILDNDGVMTPGTCNYLSEDDAVGVEYSVLDGYALANVGQTGVQIAIVSGRRNEALYHRLKTLKLEQHLYMGVSHKGTYIKKLKEDFGLTTEQVAYIGDDFIDLSAFAEVGLAITVPDCHPMVKKYVNYVTLNHGGHGAVREVLDLLRIANPDDSEFTQKLIEFYNSGE